MACDKRGDNIVCVGSVSMSRLGPLSKMGSVNFHTVILNLCLYANVSSLKGCLVMGMPLTQLVEHKP